MRILTRYVLREFIIPLFYCLTGFISIYILFELFGSFSRLVSAEPSAETVVLYFASYFAPYFEWIAPACLMLATLYTMWNFCRHSEIIAMRASGISFFAIVKPLLGTAFVMALLVAWVGEVFVPDHAQWAVQYKNAKFKLEEMSRFDDIVYRNSEGDRTWKIGAIITSDATVFEDVKVSVDYPTGGRKMTIVSPRAEFLDGAWWFQNVSATYFKPTGEESASPTPELDKLSFRSFPDFKETPEDFLMQNRDFKYYSTSERLRYFKKFKNLPADRLSSLKYDFWAKIFAPLACLVITLFAIPAGIATGRQSVFRGIVGAIAMFFAFYALTIGFMVLAKKGIVPPLPAAIIPDLIFFAIGCHLFYKNR
jgi:lipopolysaccharide export system permease protein